MAENKNNIRFEISVINCLKQHPICHVLTFLIFRPQRISGMGEDEGEGKNNIRFEIKVINLLEKTPHMPYFQVLNFSPSEGIGYEYG